MIVYVYNIHREKELDDQDMEMYGQMIYMYKGVFNGYTTNRIIMKNYIDQMEPIIGKYLHYDIEELNIPDDTPREDMQDVISTAISGEIYTQGKYIREAISSWSITSSSFSIINAYNTDNNRSLCFTEEYLSFITQSFYRELDVIEKILYLFSRELTDYIPIFNRDCDIVDFKQAIMDNMLPLLKDYYDNNSMHIDVYELAYWYLITYQFLN